MKKIWFPFVAVLIVMFSLVPMNALDANATTYTYTYHQINMSSVFNSDAYTSGQNYTGGTKYPVNPGTTYTDPVYGNVPMDMRVAGQNNVWLSHGLSRTSAFTTQITLTTNIQNAVAIWLVGLDGGWVYNGAELRVKYKLDGAYTTLTYLPNDWGYAGTGTGLTLWVNRGGTSLGDIAVARIDLPNAGSLAEITVIDPETGTSGGASFPIFAVTVAERVVPVNVDIKPMSGSNPFNVNAKGVLPVAILGTATFDVSQIDPASIELEGVATLRWALEDVGTVGDPLAGPDGYMDLTLKFDAQAIVNALDAVNDGDIETLDLTGSLKEASGGEAIVGDDEVIIINKK